MVVSSTLPGCTVEDGSSGPTPCSWNIGPDVPASDGLAYWIGAQGRFHYVWNVSPERNGWHFTRSADLPEWAVVRDGRYKLPNGNHGRIER